MVDDGSLKIRLWVMIRASNDDLAANLADYRMVGYGGDRLTVRGIKKSIDGALGSHGAWLLEPYDDLPSSTGLTASGNTTAACWSSSHTMATSSASSPSPIVCLRILPSSPTRYGAFVYFVR